MNSKYIMTFFIVLNALTVILGSACVDTGSSCSLDTDGLILSKFFFIDPATNFAASGSVQATTEINDVSSGLLSEQPGVNTGQTGLTSFLDPLKMFLGVLVFLTPLPLIDLMGTFGMPLFLNIFITAPLFFWWLIGVTEAIGGRSFGK